MPKKLVKSAEYSVFFNSLIDVCDKRNITVTSVLEEFASSHSALTAWKNGKINADILPRLAQHLGVSINLLLTGEEPEPTEHISKDQQELLDKYKKLPEREQGRILERMNQMLETIEKNASKELYVNYKP